MARKAADREAVNKATRDAEEATAAAKRLETEKEQAKLTEELRKKQAMEAAAKELADACAGDLSELAQLREVGQAEAIQALLTHSSCPSMPAAARQAAKKSLLFRQRLAKTCADEQKSLAQIDRKDEDSWKARLDALKCPAARDAASQQLAKLEADRLRIEHECADQREKVAAVDLFLPNARDNLSKLPVNPACPALAADIKAAIASVDARISAAQAEWKRVGCYTAKPSGRFRPADSRCAQGLPLCPPCVLRLSENN